MNTTNTSVRVRFAPSPTGHLHIGGLRTAIFNWLFARHNNGVFLLRIEDTDTERSKPEYLESILEAMKWIALESDEPLVIQSSRLDEHRRVAQQLLDEGKAYRCFCSTDSLQSLKEGLLSEGKLLKYNGLCRNKKMTPELLRQPHVIRFKLPYEKGPIAFNDLIRGSVVIDAEQLEDFIIIRSDGMPMYNFVVVVDDAAMRITHIIRGEEHLLNTPKQIFLYEACGYQLPQFAHIPLILGPSGDKLSKRDGAVSVVDYRKNGYLAEALFNYLVRLGWAHGDQEVFTREQLVQFFTLEAVGKKGSIFDPVKLDWMNGVYLKASSSDYLLDQITRYVEPDLFKKVDQFSRDQILSFIGLYKERAKTLKELVDDLISLHTPHYAFDEKDILSLAGAATLTSLIERLLEELSNLSTFDAESLSVAIKQLCRDTGVALPVIAQPVRLALTGKLKSPGVFELLALLKKEESVRRLAAFLDFMKTTHQNR